MYVLVLRGGLNFKWGLVDYRLTIRLCFCHSNIMYLFATSSHSYGFLGNLSEVLFTKSYHYVFYFFLLERYVCDRQASY